MTRFQQQPTGGRGATPGHLVRWSALAVCCGAIALVWLSVLPTLSAQPELQQRMQYLDSRGIDPSAMFYTELEATDRVLVRLEQFHHECPAAFWIPEHDPGRE